MNKITCPGCRVEMYECYKWQSKGYDAGLTWGNKFNSEKHCFVFVLNKKGELIVY